MPSPWLHHPRPQPAPPPPLPPQVPPTTLAISSHLPSSHTPHPQPVLSPQPTPVVTPSCRNRHLPLTLPTCTPNLPARWSTHQLNHTLASTPTHKSAQDQATNQQPKLSGSQALTALPPTTPTDPPPATLQLLSPLAAHHKLYRIHHRAATAQTALWSTSSNPHSLRYPKYLVTMPDSWHTASNSKGSFCFSISSSYSTSPNISLSVASCPHPHPHLTTSGRA
jgi:hypothetical protein